MYSALHDNVSYLLKDYDPHYNFHENVNHKCCTEEYDINIIDQFICHNNACNINEWMSKKIAIIIQMYFRTQYNAKVYHQQC